MKHVEYFKSWLVYGQDDGAVSICQFVEVMEELNGGCSIKTCRAAKGVVGFIVREHVDAGIAPHLMLVRLEK